MKLFAVCAAVFSVLCLFAGTYYKGKTAGLKEAGAMWESVVAKANEAALKSAIQQHEAAIVLERLAQQKNKELEAQLADLEAENAKLAEKDGAHCGIDAAHIGLLNRQAGD